MPDLTRIAPNHLTATALDLLFGLRRVDTHPGEAFLISLARLADKCLHEWAAARECLGRYVGTPAGADGRARRRRLLMRAIDHLENLISSLHRALLLAERLRRDQGSPQLRRNLLPRDNEIARLGDVRDTIEHMDQWVARGATSDPANPRGARDWRPWKGEPLFLAINRGGDSVRIADKSLTFNELARWIEQVCRVTSFLTSDPAAGGLWNPPTR